MADSKSMSDPDTTEEEDDAAIASMMIEPPAMYITIRWDNGSGDLEMDLGCINHYEALGIIEACLQNLREETPPVRLRGQDFELDEDDEDDN